jgi:hypothetical protein
VAGQETLDQRDHRKTNMKRPIATAISLALLAAVPAGAQGIEIMPDGSRPNGKGVAPNFMGLVQLDAPISGRRLLACERRSGHVEPDAGTGWHTHLARQTLIVTSRTGWVEEWGG